MPLASLLLKYWDQDRSLTALLILLAFNLLVLSPASELGKFIEPLAHGSLILLLLAGVLTMRRGPLRTVTIGVVAVTLATRMTRFFFDFLWLHVAELVLTSVCYALIVYVVALMVYGEGPVTGHRIRGAVALYLLIAAAFATLYTLLEILSPGAFRFAQAGEMEGGRLRDAVTYFSMVTLTTVGYGDVTAVHPVARSLVVFEALIGQLYPAILLARLVTLYEGSMHFGRKGKGGKSSSQD
jgi:hypothetical protein